MLQILAVQFACLCYIFLGH